MRSFDNWLLKGYGGIHSMLIQRLENDEPIENLSKLQAQVELLIEKIKEHNLYRSIKDHEQRTSKKAN